MAHVPAGIGVTIAGAGIAVNKARRVEFADNSLKPRIQVAVVGRIIKSACLTRHPGCIPRTFVVTAPGDDGWVVVQSGNHGSHLALSLVLELGLVGIAPLEWEILPN